MQVMVNMQQADKIIIYSINHSRDGFQTSSVFNLHVLLNTNVHILDLCIQYVNTNNRTNLNVLIINLYF